MYCDYRYTTSPSAFVTALGWNTRYTRRILDQCTLLYKIHPRLVSIPKPTIVLILSKSNKDLEPSTGPSSQCKRNNPLQGDCSTLHQNDAALCRFSHHISLLAWFLLALDFIDTPCGYSPHLPSQYSFPSELPTGLPNQVPIPSTFKILIPSIVTGKYLGLHKRCMCTQQFIKLQYKYHRLNEVYNKICQIMYSKVNANSSKLEFK